MEKIDLKKGEKKRPHHPVLVVYICKTHKSYGGEVS